MDNAMKRLERAKYKLSIAEKALELAVRAHDEDERRNYKQAFNLYEESVGYFVVVAKYGGERLKEINREKCAARMKRAEAIRKYLTLKSKPQAEASEENACQEYLSDFVTILEDAVVIENPDVKWSDVEVSEETKNELKETVTTTMSRRSDTGNRKPRARILLYGPHGSGMMQLARAVAAEKNCSLFSLCTSELLSDVLDKNRKHRPLRHANLLLRILMQMARQRTPSVVLIDGVDFMRADGDCVCLRSLKKEFVAQLEGVHVNNEGVIVLVAKRTDSAVDGSLVDRFDGGIHVPLPEPSARTDFINPDVGENPNSPRDDSTAETERRRDMEDQRGSVK